MAANFNSDHIIDGFVDIRKKKKLSQAAVAERADLHQAAVGRIENKSTNPQLGTMIKLLNTMGYTLAIVPAEEEYDHTLMADIYTQMESLDDTSLRKVRTYVDALAKQEISERVAALERVVDMTKNISLDLDMNSSYKQLVLEELDRRYGMT